MRIGVAILALLLFAGEVRAAEVAGVTLPPTVAVGGKTLLLNGYGIRTRFFIKVYVGALYTERRISRAEDLQQSPGDVLIRMVFVLGKVEREKIVKAFTEGLANNAPDAAATEDARRFLALFNGDLVRGDVVDLVLGADGTINVMHNGSLHGTVKSARLARAIPLIYIGNKPADNDLKRGMLGSK